MQSASYVPLFPTLLADRRMVPWVRNVGLMLFASLLLTLSARCSIPFWPVPMTLQTFAVLVLAMGLGWRLAAGSVLLYLAQGAMGLPVFASGAGLGYMMGPTGGYLAGFLLAALLVGALAERGFDRSLAWASVAMVLGNVVIFSCGAFWLSQLIGMERAIEVGVMPFIPGEALKMALASWVLPLAWQQFGRHRG